MENIGVKGTGVPERQSQVSEEINRAGSAMDQLNRAISALKQNVFGMLYVVLRSKRLTRLSTGAQKARPVT